MLFKRRFTPRNFGGNRFRTLLLCATMALLCASPAPAGEKGSKPKKPQLVITASPRMSQAPIPGHARMIRLSIVIKNADEEYWCPEIRVDWAEGSVTTRESDCDPFEMAPPDELEQKSYPDTGALYHGYGEGVYIISVELRRNGKVFRRETATVQIGSEGG